MQVHNGKFWKVFKETSGAFSTAEAIALYNIVLDAPLGKAVEFGTYKGKSSQAIALGLKPTVQFWLVEPEFKSDEWLQETCNRVNNVNTEIIVIPIADYSLNVIPRLNNLAFAFVDSGLHDDMVMEESKLLEDKIITNGIIAFHDYLNQFTAVERAYNYLLSTGKFEKIEIDWQPIFDYVKENNLEEGNNSWHIYESLPHPPNFIGALKRK